jgi:hypothetical protein
MEGFPMYRFLFKFGVVILVGFFSVAWLASSACAISVVVLANLAPQDQVQTDIVMTLQAGDYLTISAAETDLWTANQNVTSYINNANGKIGEPFDNLGLNALVGALVGRIDLNVIGKHDDDYYFLIGTNFGPTKVGPGFGEVPAGPLYLLLWDGNYSDNVGNPFIIDGENINFLTANVSTVPLPPSVLLLGSGLLGLGLLRRKWGLKK